jgi:hypothetical protein
VTVLRLGHIESLRRVGSALKGLEVHWQPGGWWTAIITTRLPANREKESAAEGSSLDQAVEAAVQAWEHWRDEAAADPWYAVAVARLGTRPILHVIEGGADGADHS